MGAPQELITSWRANSFVVVAFPAPTLNTSRHEKRFVKYQEVVRSSFVNGHPKVIIFAS